MALRKPGVIALFDVDGTLTAPRKVATPHMLEFMRELRKVVTVGVVGGSDLSKITEQLGKTVIDDYDYVFSENGLVAHREGKLIGTQSLKSFLGDEKLKVSSLMAETGMANEPASSISETSSLSNPNPIQSSSGKTGTSENLSLLITNHKLNGQNYLQWSQSVQMFICGRGKEDYLTGEVPVPEKTDPTYKKWKVENH
ncbi:hypothetical protein L484_006555 [Morus notabilis]|uniref:Phosphomannomutase n=1 Tax=Morus notabilis TaxID=981085 RepID=W9RXE2_9ROSA|nr:hypothetical protein L484_006555 [Morus notabilis]